MKLNVKSPPVRTHEGAVAVRVGAEQQLRRSVMATLLWEDQFYEDGKSIADRIGELVPEVEVTKVASIAVEARSAMKLRHVPLLLVREMARHATHRALVAQTLEQVIQRPDELTEFLAIYWKDGKRPLSAQIKRGLARAFCKFDAYALGKYNRDGAVKLRDVLFLSHAKPKDAEQDAVWKRLVNGTLESPDTWEVALSAGKDKRKTWERLIAEKNLGALALLRNLRNMLAVGVPDDTIRNALVEMKTDRVLPFRFIAAARYAPQFEPQLETAMMKCLASQPKLPGHTALLVDVSSSMDGMLSAKSEMTRVEAAYGLAMLLREICDNVSVYSFSMKLCLIPPRRGFALRDAIHQSQTHEGTPLGLAVKCIYANKSFTQNIGDMATWTGGRARYQVSYAGQGLKPDRLIVITDEQSSDPVPPPACGVGYMVNVASAQHGVGYGAWKHIDGWSESIVSYIRASEGLGDVAMVD